jgi:hypothetical protein
MEYIKQRLQARGIAACILVLVSSCNDQNTANGINGSNTANDTNRVDTRRNTSDTSNYITKDSGNSSEDLIDPDRPTNSH